MESVYDLGEFELQSGAVVPNARLSYATHGTLNADRTNAIVYATWYAGRHDDNAAMIAEGRALDPTKYFIVVPDAFGNGLSTSPSNTPPTDEGFPLVTPYDNVEAQYRLLRDHLEVERVQLVVGYSMSGQQAFHWGALHSGFVERIAPLCGSSRTSPHNWLFLEGVKRALVADPTWESEPGPGIRAFSTVYASWFASQSFYRDGLHLGMLGDPLPSTEEFLDVVTSIFGSFDARDLLALLATWQAADVSVHPQFQGDWGKALGSITAKAVVMPCRHDLYFPPEDNEIEVSMMPNATLQVIPSIWGHLAAHPLFASDGIEFIEQQLQDLLSN
jgi:homoserine O-acetyltransferase/O-succinyltransferase